MLTLTLKVTVINEVIDDTKTKWHLMLYIKSYFTREGGWVISGLYCCEADTTDRSSSKRSKRDPKAKQVWVG